MRPTAGIDAGPGGRSTSDPKSSQTGYAGIGSYSSEILEVLGVSNRSFAMYDGQVTANFEGIAVFGGRWCRLSPGQYVKDSDALVPLSDQPAPDGPKVGLKSIN